MVHAIIYCRVSTEEQAQDGHHSLSAQETLCRKLAQEQGYKVLSVFRDPGKTATNMNRPGLQDALALCQSDRSIRAMFIQDTDRLARNTKDHLTIRALLQKCEVKLVSVSQPMLEDSAEGNMIDTIIASVNQFQSDITKRKTIKGLEEKVRNGGWPAKAPLGYKNVGVGADDSTRIVEVDPETAPLLKDMFRLYATGGYSLIRLAEYLHTSGLRSCNGKRVRENKLHLMLQNEFYIGVVKWHGIQSNGRHEPLIDEGTFRACGTVLRSHGGGFSRKRKHDFLLRGYLVCASCGRQLIGENHVSKRATYYRCHTRDCEPPVRMVDIEKSIEEEFRKITVPAPVLEHALQALQQEAELDKSTLQTRKASLQTQRAVLTKKRDILEAKWLSGVVDDSDFRRLGGNLKDQIQSIDIGLLQLESRNQTDIDSIAEVIAFTRLLDVSYVKAARHVKRLLLQFAFERFEVRNRQVTRAVPSKFMGALAGAQQIAQIAHEPVLAERAPMLGGVHYSNTESFTATSLQKRAQKAGHHPTQTSSESGCVRLRPKWGPKPALNRPQKLQKVSCGGYMGSLTSLREFLEDSQYVSGLLRVYGEIMSAIRPA